ncbi:MAG TPA: helix-turn-helix transcriptional regulator [Puia sp.]|nr:helix-turn-helix transcriptional regulator [Puia sp.]
MRPQLLKVSSQPGHSFSVRRDLAPDINNKWHFHAEVELLHFKRGDGTQFVGDNISRFRPGDVVLVGANLPHYWRFDEGPVDVIVTHFAENCWGGSFLDLPENVRLKALMDKAKRGLQVEGGAKRKIARLVERLPDSEGMPRMILLMEVLHVLAESDRLQPLASMGFRHSVTGAGHERVNSIYDYSLRHFRHAIQLEEIAAVANISPNSFCRFFKSRTGKTYSRFLLELRVGHACKLLIENNFSIKQICFESGFNNFTGFYKYFKLITGKSPLGYQKLYNHEPNTLVTYPAGNARTAPCSSA